MAEPALVNACVGFRSFTLFEIPRTRQSLGSTLFKSSPQPENLLFWNVFHRMKKKCTMHIFKVGIQQGFQTLLFEDHISCCTTLWGPDILRNMIVSGYVKFYQINKCFINSLFVHYGQMYLRPDEIASRAGYVCGAYSGYPWYAVKANLQKLCTSSWALLAK